MINTRQILQNKSLCLKYFKIQHGISKSSMAWKHLYQTNLKLHSWNVFSRFSQREFEENSNIESSAEKANINEEVIISKFKLNNEIGLTNLSIIKETLSPYTVEPIEKPTLREIDEEVKSARPTKSKILSFTKKLSYPEIVQLKSTFNMNQTEYGFVLKSFLDQKIQILKENMISNNYDFRDIWNLLFNSNKSLIRKINKVSPEDNKQQMESKEDAAEEENSNQFNFIDSKFTTSPTNLDVLFKFCKMIRYSAALNKNVKVSIAQSIVDELKRKSEQKESLQIEEDNFDINKLSLINLSELNYILHLLDMKDYGENFGKDVAQALLKFDFNMLTTDIILGIITFEPFKKDLMLQYELKNKLISNTNLNSNSIMNGPSPYEIIKALCNLELNSEADFSLVKKIFTDYSYHLMYRGTYFSDHEFNLLVDTLCYLKAKQPLFFHFYKDEIPHILNIIKKKFDHNKFFDKEIDLNLIAKITNTFSESLKRPDFLFFHIIENKEKMQKIEEKHLLLLIQLIKNRADEYFVFDHLTHSKKKKDRGFIPFSFHTFGVIFKIKDDFLNSETKLEEYQFLGLCRLFGSDTLSTLMQKYVKTEELSSFVKTLNKYITMILGKDEFREKI